MATMDDVSKEAGVSRGTVSNYINGKRIRPDNADKIQKAIKKLDYIPDASAQTLKRNRSNYVVLIIPRVNTPFFSQLAYDIQLALRESGFKMILCNSNSELKKEIEYIQMAKSQKVAGIITISYSNIAKLVPPEIPLVAFEKKVSKYFPLIVSDNYKGGQLAAKKLKEKKARRLLFVSKKPIRGIGVARKKGFVDYCNKHHLDYSFCIAKNRDRPQIDFENFISKSIKNNQFAYDGVFSDTDEYASDFWYLLMKYHIKVPEQVQIIGFDGSKIYPRQKVALSSIRQPTEDIAKFAVQYLENQFFKKNHEIIEYKPVVLPVSFVAGLTTK